MAHRGKSLRAMREQKQIQLKRIADDTRITIWYLSAIEEERFDRFPGKFYFKSFAGEYARSLGLDPGEVIQDLQYAYDKWLQQKTEQDDTVRPIASGGFFTRFAGRFLKPPEV